MKETLFFTLFFILILSAGAGTQFPHSLYGEVEDGTGVADGASVVAFLKNQPTDILFDTVGAEGNFGQSGWWKINTYNFQSDLQDGDVIIVRVTDGNGVTGTASIALDLAKGNQQVAAIVLGTDARSPHTLYGFVKDGTGEADGAIATVYPKGDASDTVTDTVGPLGNFGQSGWWKVNLWNLQSSYKTGDVFVITIQDGKGSSAKSEFTIDLSLANEDVGTLTLAGIASQDVTASSSGGSSSGRGSSGGVFFSGETKDSSGDESCSPSWSCVSWTDCSPDGLQSCKEWQDANACGLKHDGSNTRECENQETGGAGEETAPSNQGGAGQINETGTNIQKEEGLGGVTGGVISSLGSPSTFGVIFLVLMVAILIYFYHKH